MSSDKVGGAAREAVDTDTDNDNDDDAADAGEGSTPPRRGHAQDWSARRYTTEENLRPLREQRESGLGIKEYGAEFGLNSQRLCTWQRRTEGAMGDIKFRHLRANVDGGP